MSSGGDSGASSDPLSGVSDQTFSDASLGDQITGGSGDIFGTGDTSAFGGGGSNAISNVVSALSGGGVAGAGPAASPTLTQAASLSPPSAATGGDPVGSASGTQSATTPGSTPANSNQPQGGQSQNQPQDHAPPSAVAELKTLLKALSGKPTGPTGPIQAVGAPSAAARLPPATQGFPGSQPGGAADIPAGIIPGDDELKFDPRTGLYAPQPGMVMADDQGNPITAAGTRADQTPLPPARPGDQPAGPGRDITVNKPAAQAMPFPQGEPGEVAPGGPALPTKKPTQPPVVEQPAAAEPPQATPPPPPPPPRLLQDIAGISTGQPTGLAELAKVAMALAPLIGMFGGGGGRRGHRHGFQGMRGFRPFGAPGGFRGFHPPGGRRAWPYYHPQMGWHMHGGHPGPGWLPLNPADAQSIVGGGQGGQDPNAPDPDRPPKETGADAGPPDKVGTSGAIPGVGAKQVDDYTRQAAAKWGIDPNVASKFLGQESSYGQARRPGDNGTSFGPFQLHFAPDGRAMGDDFRRDTGLDPRDPSTWKDQIDYAMKRAAMGGWGPWTTTMNKLGMNQWSGITTDRRFAGQPRGTTQPSNMVKAAAIPTTLPPSSQPMVAGP